MVPGEDSNLERCQPARPAWTDVDGEGTSSGTAVDAAGIAIPGHVHHPHLDHLPCHAALRPTSRNRRLLDRPSPGGRKSILDREPASR
jgi:hypothetical protein